MPCICNNVRTAEPFYEELNRLQEVICKRMLLQSFQYLCITIVEAEAYLVLRHNDIIKPNRGGILPQSKLQSGIRIARQHCSIVHSGRP